jgi:tetratricopeptide (TPR) repeat protein
VSLPDAPTELLGPGSSPGVPLDLEEEHAFRDIAAQLFRTPDAPVRLSRYILLRRLAAGGAGVVFEAFDPELDRKVAVKLLHAGPDGGTGSTQARSRLLREAKALANFAHPNIVAVYDVGTFDGPTSSAQSGEGVFLVMELVEGQTLRAWLDDSHPTTKEILATFVSIGRGLEAAHEAGLVHRDIKPQNVIIGADGRVRVLDFGLARRLDESPPVPRIDDDAPSSEEVTADGMVMGTPAYMSPEQHFGKTVDPSTDVYSYCVTLLEAITGTRPFRKRSPEAMARVKLAWPPTDFPAILADLPHWQAGLIHRGLQPDPDARPTIRELTDTLESVPKRRRRRIAWAGGTLALALAGIAGGRVATTGAETDCGSIPAPTAWDDEARAQLTDGFAALKKPYASDALRSVLERLDAHATSWLDARVRTCEAVHMRHEVSEAVGRDRDYCLERARVELESTIDLFRSPDEAIVLDAVEIADALPDPSRCLTPEIETDLPIDEAQRDANIAAQALRARAWASRYRGERDEVMALAAEALARAKESQYRPTQSNVLITTALLHQNFGEHDEAVRDMTRALVLAERGGHEGQATQVMVLMVGLFSAGGDFQEAERLAQQAEARLQNHPARAPRATLAAKRGRLLSRRGQLDLALRHHNEAIELRDLESPGRLVTATGLIARGILLNRLNRPADARADFERALTLVVKQLGGSHPRASAIRTLLGTTLALEGRTEDAIAEFRAAVQIAERAYTPDDARIAGPHSLLAEALWTRGAHEDARTHVGRATKALEHASARALGDQLATRRRLTTLLTIAGELGSAEAMIRTTIERVQEGHGDVHAELAETYRRLAALLGQSGRTREAIRELERALTAAPRDAEVYVRVRGDLGRAQRAWAETLAGDAPAVAREWGERAVTELRFAEAHDEAEDVVAWLGTLRDRDTRR